MAPPVDRLLGLAQTVLDAVVANWSDDAFPLPDLQYVADGAVPWDGCPTLAVSYVRSYPAPSGDVTLEQLSAHPRQKFTIASVWDVWLLRCVPDMDVNGTDIVMPAPDEVEAAADEVLVDAQALMNAVLSGVPGCQHAALESCTAAGPQGGMAGNVVRVRLL